MEKYGALIVGALAIWRSSTSHTFIQNSTMENGLMILFSSILNLLLTSLNLVHLKFCSGTTMFDFDWIINYGNIKNTLPHLHSVLFLCSYNLYSQPLSHCDSGLYRGRAGSSDLCWSRRVPRTHSQKTKTCSPGIQNEWKQKTVSLISTEGALKKWFFYSGWGLQTRS